MKAQEPTDDGQDEQLREVQEAYQAGIRKALLWIYNPRCADVLDFSDCKQEWAAMGTGLDNDKMCVAVEELKTRQAE